MSKILIISDTHGDKKDFVELIKIENPDYVIHAGDFCVDIRYIAKYCDYFVRGNNDDEGEKIKLFEIDQIKFFLTHGDEKFFNLSEKSIAKDAKLYDAKIAIYGHTHVETIKEVGGVLVINPGSLSFPRNKNREKTYAILNLNNGEIEDYQIKKWNR